MVKHESPRVVAQILRIAEISESVRAGRVRVPRFQRPFVWSVEHVAQLWDSIVRGYPIGTLLLWQHDAPAQVEHFGPITIAAPAHQDAWWIVDGQQRIISIVGTLHHPAEDRDPSTDPFRLFYDLEQNAIASAAEWPPPRTWLPLNVLSDPARLLRFIRDLDEGLRVRAMEVARAVRDYGISASFVSHAGESEVLEIFMRLNVSGVRLSGAELFNALARSTTTGEVRDLRHLNERLAEHRFGHFDEDLLYRAVMAAEALKAPPGGLTPETAAGALERTLEALGNTIVFLKDDAGIPHLDLVPDIAVLLALVRFFRLHSSPAPRSRRLLSRWLWRSALARVAGDITSARVDKLIGLMMESEDCSVQALLALVPRTRSAGDGPVPLSPVAPGRGRSAILAGALLSLRPRSFSDGKPIDPSELFQSGVGSALVHLLPRATLREHPETARFADSLTNRLAQASAIKLDRAIDEELFRRQPDLWGDVLRSHAIPHQAFGSLRGGDVTRFLTLRELELRRIVDDFVAGRAEWGDSDRRPLRSLIIPDGDD